MITKQTICKEFDEKFSKNSGGIINFIDPMSEDMNVTSHKIKSFYDSKIQSLLEQIMLEEQNWCDYDFVHFCISGKKHIGKDDLSIKDVFEGLKSRIINAGFEVK